VHFTILLPTDKTKMIESLFNTGYWLFEPRDQGRKTHVTYYLWTSPVGDILIRILNRANSISLPDLWKAVKRRIKTNKNN
jgi:hypothetical protein